MRATLFLIISCFIAYPYGFRDVDTLAYSYNNFVHKHEWWTVITALFIHGSLGHLLSNMLFLFVFGKALENIIGSVKLLICFFSGGISSLLASHLFYQSDIPNLGASGAICSIIGLLMIFRPWKMSFLLNFFPMPMGVAALTYLFVNFLMIYHRPYQSANGVHVAYEIHIAGFFVGIILGIMWNKDWKKNLLISILSFLGFYAILWIILYLLNLGSLMR